MTDPKSKTRHILRKLFKNANGDAADAIGKYQGKELPNFGIMYPDIKALSAQFDHDNAVATELIVKNTREARIMAMLLVDVENMDASLLKVFIEKSETEELKNHLARHVLAPFLSYNSWHSLNPLIGKSLAAKTAIQYFRAFRQLPAYETTLHLLKDWIKGQYQPIIDGAHLAEVIYRHFPEKRSHFEHELQKISLIYPEVATEIQNWRDDFQYLK